MIQTLEDMLWAYVSDFKEKLGWPLASHRVWVHIIVITQVLTLFNGKCIYDLQLVHESLKIAQSHQNFYTNVKQKYLEFGVDDWVYLKFHSCRVLWYLGRKKISIPHYIVPYWIWKKMGKVSYELELPLELIIIYRVLHISILKKCKDDHHSSFP